MRSLQRAKVPSVSASYRDWTGCVEQTLADISGMPSEPTTGPEIENVPTERLIVIESKPFKRICLDCLLFKYVFFMCFVVYEHTVTLHHLYCL